MLLREVAKSSFPNRKAFFTTGARSCLLAPSSRAQARRCFSSNRLPEQNVSALPNGVRVASEDTPGHFCGIGVYVDAGSRYEWAGDSGSTHMIDRLAWKSSEKRTAQQMSSEIESLGGQFSASSSRETILYQAATYSHPENLSRVLSILGDAVLRPKFTEEELEVELEGAAYEISEVEQKSEAILPEVLHEVAFKGNTLGNPLLCPPERLSKITAHDLRKFRETWYRPERIVVAGAGVNHGFLRDMAEKEFGDLKAVNDVYGQSTGASRSAPNGQTAAVGAMSAFHTSAAENAQVVVPPSYETRAFAKARYTGGSCFLDEPSVLPHGALPNMIHLHVGFNGLSIHDEDIYALATIQMLLGGGGSFSAGGPGKGMYSRLYTTVLNQHYLVDHCASFHHCYNDGGLFGISISLDRRIAGRAGALIAEQFAALTEKGHVTEEELARARNQLKSSLVMALESRMVQVEDLGRQTLVNGHRVPVEEICSKIDAVQIADVHRVARRLLCESGSPPTVVAQGKLDGLGDVTETLGRYGLGTRRRTLW